MCALNDIGSKLSTLKYVNAVTDVTGFGLAGHLLEVCKGSEVSAEIYFESLPLLPNILKYIENDCVPGGTARNFESYGSHLGDLSEIEKYTNINETIMYANTVPDAWCVTKRKIVQDPAFYKKNTSNRILEEVRRFDVDYLLVDVSDQIYQRGKDIGGAIKFYNQLELEEIFSDEKNGYHFYKIANKR